MNSPTVPAPASKLKAGLALAFELAGVAVTSMAATAASFALAGSVLSVGVAFALRDRPGQAALIIVLTMVEVVIVGGFIGMKRGLITAVAHGVAKRGLARHLFAAVFDQLLGVRDDDQFRDRGNQIARGLERVPLAEAELLLHAAIQRVLGEENSAPGVRGWMARLIRQTMVGAVEKYTLTRFRETGVTSGGVDLALIRKELEPKIDILLSEKLSGSLKLWMLAAFIGLPMAVIVDYLVVRASLGG